MHTQGLLHRNILEESVTSGTFVLLFPFSDGKRQARGGGWWESEASSSSGG